MLPEGVEVRPMQGQDVTAVLSLIEQHDEDDAEAAKESYEESGLADQFVLTEQDKIIGVTGFRPVEGTDNTCWLSWTYMLPEKQGQGYGTRVLESLIEHLKEINVRKIFVSTSDYREEDGAAAYEAAQKMYETVGFKEELRHPDYYAPGETQIVYGLAINSPVLKPAILHEEVFIEFTGMHEIEETEDTYHIQWQAQARKLFGKNTQFTLDDLELAKSTGAEWEARSLLISFPSNIPSVVEPLFKAGFSEAGRLKDYYEEGLDEVHYRFVLLKNTKQ